MLNYTGFFQFNNFNYLVNIFYNKNSNSLFCSGTSYFLNILNELENSNKPQFVSYFDNFIEHELEVKFIDSKLISNSLYFHFELVSSTEKKMTSKIHAVSDFTVPGTFYYSEKLDSFVFSINKNLFDKLNLKKPIPITFTYLGNRVIASYLIDFIESNSYDSDLNLFLHKIS